MAGAISLYMYSTLSSVLVSPVVQVEIYLFQPHLRSVWRWQTIPVYPGWGVSWDTEFSLLKPEWLVTLTLTFSCCPGQAILHNPNTSNFRWRWSSLSEFCTKQDRGSVHSVRALGKNSLIYTPFLTSFPAINQRKKKRSKAIPQISLGRYPPTSTLRTSCPIINSW